MVWNMGSELMSTLQGASLRWSQGVALVSCSENIFCWEQQTCPPQSFGISWRAFPQVTNGDTYHFIAKNCNHFTDDVSLRLIRKPIPGWVNRLARVASFCNCLPPENIQVQAVRHLPNHPIHSDDDDNDNSDSASSASTDSRGEDPDHHLLTTPNSEIAYPKDRPVRLAKEFM